MAGPAELLRVHDGHAYVASGKTLTIWDVTNPAAPKKSGAFAFPKRFGASGRWSDRLCRG